MVKYSLIPMEISLVLRLYLTIYPSSGHNTDRVKLSTVKCSAILWSVDGSLLLIASQLTAPATGDSQSGSF